MPTLMLTADQRFEFTNPDEVPTLARRIEGALFNHQGFEIVKGFVAPDVAARIRDFYAGPNAGAFHDNRTFLQPFNGQRYVIYYPDGPFPVPPAMRSLYEQISMLRNMAYARQPFFHEYCRSHRLDPDDATAVYRQQIRHTWFRVSWYENGDGQHPHRDQPGEIAAFLMLTRKGVHWTDGGLRLHDGVGRPTVDVDALCEPGDLLWLDQHQVVHGVDPVTGAAPGRMLIYVPIIPISYIEKWFTFEGHPWKLHHSRPPGTIGRVTANIANILQRASGRSKLHYSRRRHVHRTLELA